MIGMYISGLVEVQKICKQLGEEKIYNDVVKTVGEKAEKYAIQMCPVDTGELQGSIYLDVDKDGFELGASAGHAVFNEYGSITTPIGSISSPKAAKKTGFRPFLRPSVYKATRQAPEIFGKKLASISAHGGKA